MENAEIDALCALQDELARQIAGLQIKAQAAKQSREEHAQPTRSLSNERENSEHCSNCGCRSSPAHNQRKCISGRGVYLGLVRAGDVADLSDHALKELDEGLKAITNHLVPRGTGGGAAGGGGCWGGSGGGPPGTRPPGGGGNAPPGTTPPGGGGNAPPGAATPGVGGNAPPGTTPPGGGGGWTGAGGNPESSAEALLSRSRQELIALLDKVSLRVNPVPQSEVDYFAAFRNTARGRDFRLEDARQGLLRSIPKESQANILYFDTFVQLVRFRGIDLEALP